MASKPTLLKWEEEKVSRELPIGAGAGETAHANPDSLDTPTIPQSGSKVNYLHLNTVQEKDSAKSKSNRAGVVSGMSR